MVQEVTLDTSTPCELSTLTLTGTIVPWLHPGSDDSEGSGKSCGAVEAREVALRARAVGLTCVGTVSIARLTTVWA